VGGTGITPAFQLLNTVFSSSNITRNAGSIILPTFTILYGASKPSSLLLLPELVRLQKEFPDHIDIQLQVDQLDEATAQTISWPDWIMGRRLKLEGMEVQVGRIDEKAVKAALERSSKKETDSRRILVCGPDGMVAHIAGPKQGKMQGRLGGILSDLKCIEEEVWKL
jgi:NAD(P)H-flavin reductase